MVLKKQKMLKFSQQHSLLLARLSYYKIMSKIKIKLVIILVFYLLRV